MLKAVGDHVCVCFLPIYSSSSLDVPAGVTQEVGHTGFLIHLRSAVHALFGVLGPRCWTGSALLDCHVIKGFGIYMIGILGRLY